MYLPSSGIHVSDQNVTISRAEILMTFFLMNPMPPDFGCRSLRFKRSEGECAPQRYVFKETYLPMGKELMTHDCRYECLMETNCLSVNIGPPNETGFRLCQLSNFDHTQHGENKEIRKGFILWASEVGFYFTLQYNRLKSAWMFLVKYNH